MSKGAVEDNPKLPPWGHYCQFPNWFTNYCLPKLSPPASALYVVLWAGCHPKSEARLKASIRTLMRLTGQSSGLVQRAISELEGRELIEGVEGKHRRDSNTYTVRIYPADGARLKFKNMPKFVCSKKAQRIVSNRRTQKPKDCIDLPHTFQYPKESAVDDGKLVSMPRRSA